MEKILLSLKQYRIQDAFEAIVRINPLDNQTKVLFQRILGINWNLFKLHDFSDLMKNGAENGDIRFQYAWARYNDAIRPSVDSAEIAANYYTKAAEAGFADAIMCLGHFWNEGEFGQVDREKYCSFKQRAIESGSEMARLQDLRDILWGNNGQDRDPIKVYDDATKFIESSGSNFPSQYYSVVACACEELGRSMEAYTWYEKAFAAGDPKSCLKMAILSGGLDDEGNVIRQEDFLNIVEKGVVMGIADCETYPMYAFREKDFDKLSDNEQGFYRSEIVDHLTNAFNLGDSNGALFLGDCYQLEHYGFKKDFELAWQWYSRGARLNNCLCYQRMADMIVEKVAPKEYDYDFMYRCELSALRFGYDDTLINVVRAYKQGHLRDFAGEIERYYLPIFEELYDFDDDDDELLSMICP